jgi:DNA-binding NtrC family response regulator
VSVITDLEMQPIDGMQVLKIVVHSHVATPVNVITGKPSEHTQGCYLQRGASSFFRKPIDGDALMDLLDNIARKQLAIPIHFQCQAISLTRSAEFAGSVALRRPCEIRQSTLR